MSTQEKQLPTVDNDIFDPTLKTVSEATGIDVEDVNQRGDQLDEAFEGLNFIEACEYIYKNFKKKELVVMLANEMRAKRQSPLDAILGAILAGREE